MQVNDETGSVQLTASPVGGRVQGSAMGGAPMSKTWEERTWGGCKPNLYLLNPKP